ncbi:MAG TPA: pirin family protein [Turneriella sp.]|nr:pirin family protein [Turneriella sp.]
MINIIDGKIKDLGDGFQVRRILPHGSLRTVGPFVFVDHMGPVKIERDKALTVRAHPHIGLSTVTYLYEGVIHHKDSIGSDVLIYPNEVNWMTAGRGIVHSEHSRLDPQFTNLHGMQVWVALPKEYEEVNPTFEHYDAAVLPEIKNDAYTLRIIAGSFMGQSSPVKTHSPLFYADLQLKKNIKIPLDFPRGHDAALYVARGEIRVSGQSVLTGAMIALTKDTPCEVEATEDARIAILGGEPLKDPRHLWWNFVSTSKERIEEAKEAWRKNAMGAVAGETDRIPLP